MSTKSQKTSIVVQEAPPDHDPDDCIVCQMTDWLYENPGKGPGDFIKKVIRDRWKDLADYSNIK